MVGNLGPATFGRDDNALVLVDAAGERELAQADKLTSRANSSKRSRPGSLPEQRTRAAEPPRLPRMTSSTSRFSTPAWPTRCGLRHAGQCRPRPARLPGRAVDSRPARPR